MKPFTFTVFNLFFCRWRSISLKVFWSDNPSLSDQPGVHDRDDHDDEYDDHDNDHDEDVLV